MADKRIILFEQQFYSISHLIYNNCVIVNCSGNAGLYCLMHVNTRVYQY